MVAVHLVSTITLVTVMVEVRADQAAARQMTDLMRALAISICGRPPSAIPASL